MQAIAEENNLTQTPFFAPDDKVILSGKAAHYTTAEIVM